MNKTKLIYLIIISAAAISVAVISIINDIPDEKPIMTIKEASTSICETTETSSQIKLTTTKESTTKESKKVTEKTVSTKKVTVKIQDTTTIPEEETQAITECTTIPSVNLNTATLDELMMIPEIDEELANKIIEMRTTIQYFSSPYELLYIDTMTETRLSKIIDYVYTEQIS